MDKVKGMGFALVLAGVAFVLGRALPVIGGPVFAIVLGMLLHPWVRRQQALQSGIRFTAKKVLQLAVILLGFGLNISVVLETGAQSLPIIVATIGTALLLAWGLQKALGMDVTSATLVGVGSSICGGSAIAATAPVIDADDGQVAQAMSVIFFFNVLAALLFPALGSLIGFSTQSGEAFGIFAGTAVNDTSSVTAAAATWDVWHNLGHATLDKAVTVKLTRTLAIIPITLALAFWRARGAKKDGEKISPRSVFPFFIVFFILASLVTTLLTGWGVDPGWFAPFKTVSRFLIVMAMGAIGLNTDMVKLVRTGGKPLLLGFVCWTGITLVSLGMQRLLGLW